MSKQGKVMVTVSREELIERLREQILFLLSSVRLFDEGQIAEAKRIALHLSWPRWHEDGKG